jgi:hypothetical protein
MDKIPDIQADGTMHGAPAAHSTGSIKQVYHFPDSIIIKIPRPGKPWNGFPGQGMITSVDGSNQVDFICRDIAGVLENLVIDTALGTKPAVNTTVEVRQ